MKVKLGSMKLAEKILESWKELYELKVFMHKFKRGILPINFKPYFNEDLSTGQNSEFTKKQFYFKTTASIVTIICIPNNI